MQATITPGHEMHHNGFRYVAGDVVDLEAELFSVLLKQGIVSGEKESKKKELKDEKPFKIDIKGDA